MIPKSTPKKIIVVGSGNAALCAGIAALELGAEVTIVEKANAQEAGGNTKYTSGAMRFVYQSSRDLLPLLKKFGDKKLTHAEFGMYSREKFRSDLLTFNDGRPLSMQQNVLINKSYETMRWLSDHGIKFESIYSRQSFEKNGKHIFWGGLTLAAEGEGVGLFEAELKVFLNLSGVILYGTSAENILTNDSGLVVGLECSRGDESIQIEADAVILACGGFQANPEMRKKYLGETWANSKVRGTRHNTGKGLEMAFKLGAGVEGPMDGCHATPMDRAMPDNGNLDIPYIERKNYRKICYFLGIMLNLNGDRFVDEGENFRNYTYAQFGKAILNQPKHQAWQIFDSKVEPLFYEEYRFWDASFVEANTLDELVEKMDGVNKEQTLKTIHQYNFAVNDNAHFDPTILDSKSTNGLIINKTNWANRIDSPPFKAYPVTCGITFTYGGLKVNAQAEVLRENGEIINGLYAAGELVGGVFYNGYPGGSGLTSGAVFGRIAGHSAAQLS